MGDGRKEAVEPAVPRWHFAAWCVALAGGLWFRLGSLGAESLWLDEGFSVHLATCPELFSELARESNPPAFFWLLRWWQSLVGLDPSLLRLLPATLSSLSLGVYALTWFGLNVRSTTRLFAVTCYALSPFLCWYARELRPYAAVELGTALLFLAWSRGLIGERLRAAALGALGAALACLSHYHGGFAVLAVGTLAVVTRPSGIPHWWSWGAGPLVGALAALPVYLTLLPSQLEGDWGAQAHRSLGYLASLPLRLTLVQLRLLSTPSLVCGGGLVVFGLLSGAVAAMRAPTRALATGLGTASAVPVVVALVLCQFVEPRFTARYFVTVPVFLCGFLGLGLGQLPARLAFGGWLLVASAFGLVCVETAGLGSKDGYREACASVAARWRDGDRLGTITGMPSGFDVGPLPCYLDARLLQPGTRIVLESRGTLPEHLEGRIHVVIRYAPYTERWIRLVLDRYDLLYAGPQWNRVQHVILGPR